MSRPETLEKRYTGKITGNAMDFMKSCLQMQISDRITAAEALNHPYFDEVREDTEFRP